MSDILLFGGTSEGRELCSHISRLGLRASVCVATEYGEGMLPPMQGIEVQIGRKDAGAITSMIQSGQPRMVIDATHPYATAASANVRQACMQAGIAYTRLKRPSSDGGSYNTFDSIEGMVEWVNSTDERIFSSMGSKHAGQLAAITGHGERVTMRILPDRAALDSCLALGYAPRNIICMQGPFSTELNIAMFRQTGAAILLTKESGSRGGFAEKLEAARHCNMKVAVLSRPEESGYTLDEIKREIERLRV